MAASGSKKTRAVGTAVRKTLAGRAKTPDRKGVPARKPSLESQLAGVTAERDRLERELTEAKGRLERLQQRQGAALQRLEAAMKAIHSVLGN